MQLALFQTFAAECRKELASYPGGLALEFFYYFEQNWFDEQSSQSVSALTASNLSKCLADGGDHHPPKSLSAYFSIPELDLVVRATFPTSPQKKTRTNLSQILARCLEHANNAFKVSHNPTTGLLAKDAFIDLLKEKLLTPISGEQASTATSESDLPRLLAVYALDIDHFKQVNDSYGHLYGDLVIKSFALRVDNSVRDFVESVGGGLVATTAHFSGEEFFILAEGATPPSTFADLAEYVRSRVGEIHLPSDQEIALCARAMDLSHVPLPPLPQRAIRCSVGFAVSSPGKSSDDIAPAAAALLSQSDIALYKSKASGRNCVTSFSDILEKCGRVLEHRSDIDVITIDIGSNVGVSRGQEFKVFHPDFVGTVPYVLDDGRSKRSLGIYPRLESGRIYAFDVQKDISFCKPSTRTRDAQFTFKPGSALEAVPLGAISHLVTGPGTGSLLLDGSTDIASPTEFTRRLAAASPDRLSVAVLRIQNEKDLLDKLGSVSVNHALLSLYQAIKEGPKDAILVGQIEPTKLSLLLTKQIDRNDLEEQLEGVLTAATRLSSGTASYAAGIYHYFYKLDPNLSPEVRAAHILDLARYAASDQSLRPGLSVEVFSSNTATRIMLSRWERREISQGVQDYTRLKELGVTSASMENFAGHILDRDGKTAEACICYENAAALAPDQAVYRMNAGVLKYRMGNSAEAYAAFAMVPIDKLEEAMWPWGRLIHALTMFSQFERAPDSIDKAYVEACLQTALREYTNEKHWARVRAANALEKINSA